MAGQARMGADAERARPSRAHSRLLHPISYTLRPTSYTLHPTPYALYSTPTLVSLNSRLKSKKKEKVTVGELVKKRPPP